MEVGEGGKIEINVGFYNYYMLTKNLSSPSIDCTYEGLGRPAIYSYNMIIMRYLYVYSY